VRKLAQLEVAALLLLSGMFKDFIYFFCVVICEGLPPDVIKKWSFRRG